MPNKNHRYAMTKFLLLALMTLVFTISSSAQASPYPTAGPEDQVGQEVYSPYVGRAYPDQVLFGDAHFHTNLSFDAGLIGTRLDMDAGYRFARGEKVLSNSGQPVQLIRPLDFLFITDHAEMIGLAPMLQGAHPDLLADPWGKWAYERFNSGLEGRQEVFANIIELATVKGVNPFSSDAAARSIWLDFVEKAEQYNEPGVFSAMTGFEWTSTPQGDNLHRVVLFADGAEKTSQTLPFSMFDSDRPEDLWEYLAGYEAKTGGRAFAVPHNGNLSNGIMFSEVDSDGANLDRVQVIKGWVDASGETHERIYDIAVSGDRTIGEDGRAREAVGSTVDIEKATYSNTIGSPVLSGFWKDPDFIPADHAFYYVRVLEIPTPRWTTYDAAFYGIERPKNVPATTQDRAYTSPIWYKPKS